jgi:hypothetical protein
MSILEELQEWFKLNCNGDWEHEYGINISTLDNPGWSLKIDLKDTALENFTYSLEIKNGENDWMDIKVVNNEFIGYGDPTKLEKLVECFLSYEIYAPLTQINKIWKPVNARMIAVNQFEIIEVPLSEWTSLKAFKLEDFDEVKRDQVLKAEIPYSVGDIVACDLIHFFDYPSLAIKSRVS